MRWRLERARRVGSGRGGVRGGGSGRHSPIGVVLGVIVGDEIGEDELEWISVHGGEVAPTMESWLARSGG